MCVTNNDVLQPSSSAPEHTNSASHSSAAPALLNTSTIDRDTSTIQAANDERRPQDHILPNLSGSPEVESLGNDTDAAATRRRIQVLTKDELKELLKTRNLAGPGINKSNKDGEYRIFHSHLI
jgi:hypothetical protein